MRLDIAIEELSARQHGCVAVWQLRGIGASSTEITRLRQSRRWESIARRLLRLVGSPSTNEQRACAAVLEGGPGAALSHQSAAALWGLGASYRLVPTNVMAARGSAAHLGELGRIHPLAGVSARWLTMLGGIAVVRPELCVYQLCGLVSPLRAERALDTGWSMGLLSGGSLRACLDDLAEHGRNGTVVLRTLLEERPFDYVPPASGLEGRFKKILSEHGLNGWRRQVNSGDAIWAGRVDFRHETLPVITEVLSERYHASLSSQADDEARRRKLEAAGFVVVEVWDVEVWHRPQAAVTAVREGIRRALARAA